ncbi:hypothetical protein [Thalassolituus oleivorans]|uniref:hypothetical protein n=1 Tax=Thalassolituus oleivorans TaxID=187493 RepID=UPI0024096EBD|nr:hypothetical protein [Thalassolituus oleivorans]MDF1639988.1 hypothetical protein [Thalassolituus oleivorans]
MRLTATLGALAALMIPSLVLAGEGFVGVTAGITDSQDMDHFSENFRIVIGPNITENLSMELALLDMGEAGFDDPVADFSAAGDGVAPRFNSIQSGSVDRVSGTDDILASATYTGLSTVHPRSFLITMRYRFGLTDTIDFFIKGGANAWVAKYDEVEIVAYEDGSSTRRISKSSETSAVDLITGGGFLWNAYKSMTIRAELETTALDSQIFPRARFQLLTLGLQYEF